MSFKNHLITGSISLQSHSSQDVFALLPVGFRGTQQTDDFEMGTLPPHGYTLKPLDPQAQTTPEQDLAYEIDHYYGAKAADYELSQGHAHQQADAAPFLPLNVDVRTARRLLVQYHDAAGIVRPPLIRDLRQAIDFVEAKKRKENNQNAYVLTVYLQFDDLVQPAAL